MKHWPTKPLEEIADLYGGSTPSRGNSAFWGGDIPWVTPTDLPMPDEGISVVSKSKERITQAGLENSSATLIPKGTVLFSSRATIGKVAVADMPLTTNQGFANFVPHSKINSRFLAYALWVRRDDIARLSGSTTFKEVSRSTLRKYQLPVPPLAEQERIVKLLDEADELRKLRAQANSRSANLIPALFHEMFGDPHVNSKGCKVVRLEEVATRITDGVHLKPNYVATGVPFISVKNITTGILNFNGCKFISREDHEKFTKRCKPEYLDILYTKVGATYGRPALVDTTTEFSIYVSVCIIKPIHELIDSHFLATTLGTPAIKRQADRSIKGIGVPDLHLDQIQKFVLPLPPLPQQKEFAKRSAEIQGLESEQGASRRRLDDLFQSLLHRAFQGEL